MGYIIFLSFVLVFFVVDFFVFSKQQAQRLRVDSNMRTGIFSNKKLPNKKLVQFAKGCI